MSLARTDNVTIEVIPFNRGAHVGMQGPFVHLEFDGGLDDVAYLESGRRAGTLLTGMDERIAQLRADFEQLREETLGEEETIDFIRAVRDEIS